MVRHMRNKVPGHPAVKKHYKKLADHLKRELDGTARSFNHKGLLGRYNEHSLGAILQRHLSHRFEVTTGEVIAADENNSREIDIIIYDKIYCRPINDGDISLIPIEAVSEILSVKTTVQRGDIQDAVDNIESVRKLPSDPGPFFSAGLKIAMAKPLKPRAFLVGYESTYASAQAADKAFREIIQSKDDEVRPNGMCLLNQCFIRRRPNTVDTVVYEDDPFARFFVFLVGALSSMPNFPVDLQRYLGD
jgi:hypothetical protein